MAVWSGGFLDAADRIGSRLCRDAILADSRCNWVGAAATTTGRGNAIAYKALGADLYDGTSGVATFLAHLALQTHETLHRRYALAAARHVQRVSAQQGSNAGIGFYSGVVGQAFGLVRVGELLDDGGLVESGLDLLRDLCGETREIELDVISGCAGAIPAVLTLHARHRKAYLVELALRLGERLVAAARQREHGCSWSTISMETLDDLTGYSHGASGIALALLELAAATQDERFRRMAEGGFDYERWYFSSEHENWPDFRIFERRSDTPPAPSYPVTWCHGAPGIGLTRLRGWELTRDPLMREEGQAAVRTTVHAIRNPASQGSNYSLCHGVFGNSELLLHASAILGDNSLQLLAETVALDAAERYLGGDGAWPCGIPGGAETPGLMLGLAGIGYHYLRLHDIRANPSLVLVVPDGRDRVPAASAAPTTAT